jgi:hypothetical protein
MSGSKFEYAVEVYNKYSDEFVEQLDVFQTKIDAEKFIRTTDVEIDSDSECFGVLEIEYDSEGNEISTTRLEISNKLDESECGKIYCWMYVLKSNKGYRSEFNYKKDSNGEYEIEYLGNDDEIHHTWKKDSELDEIEVYYDDKEKSNVFAYYSLDSSLEHFIELIHKTLYDGYNNALKRAERAKFILDAFDKKCNNLKERE